MKTIKVFYATALIAVLFLCYGCPPPSDKTGKGVKLVDTSTQLVKFDTLKKSIRLINSDDYISVLNFYDSAMSTISELCDESVQDRREHYIDSAEAVSHIYDFVRFFRTDANVALNGWSEITRDSLRIYETGGAGGPVINETQHCGLKIYFCYKSAERKYYLAYRNADNMDHDVDQFPIDAELIFNGSTCAGRFTDADAASPEAIANALFTMRLPACTEAVSTLDTRKVNDEANDFNDHINQVNRQHPGVLENPIAFFHKNQLDSLLTQNDRITGVDRVVAIRFFWGFHDIQFNKIKLVAFGVNGDGKNIFRKSDGTGSRYPAAFLAPVLILPLSAMECVISIIVIYSELITPSVQRVISIIATYSALIPVVVGILAFRKAKAAYRLFILFLFYGFLTDSATWRLYDAGNYAGYRSLTYIYGMVESLFFTWFIQRTGTVLFVNIGIKICYFLFPLMWFFMHIDVSTFTWIKDTYNAQFVTIYQITIATFAAYSIFYLLKEKRFFYTPLFWFLSGIFAYCFLTFIPCAFLFTTQYKDVWYLHNLVNVMTMLLYTWGYVLIVGKNETPVVS